MRQPEQVTAQLRTRFERDYPDWARGRGTWPMRIPLEPPTTGERSGDPLTCHTWVARWRDYTGPGTIEHTNARFPTGIHPMPKTLVINRPGDVAAADPASQATWRRCGQRLTTLQRQFPQARFDRIIRRLTDLDEHTYQQLTATVAWLYTHPTSGLLLRQLPIEGIGTKWLAQHAVLVLALLGDPDFPLESTSEEDMPTSARIRLHQRLGLRTVPDLVQVAVLDPDLRAQVGGMRHFAASVEDLNTWQKHAPHGSHPGEQGDRLRHHRRPPGRSRPARPRLQRRKLRPHRLDPPCSGRDLLGRPGPSRPAIRQRPARPRHSRPHHPHRRRHLEPVPASGHPRCPSPAHHRAASHARRAGTVHQPG